MPQIEMHGPATAEISKPLKAQLRRHFNPVPQPSEPYIPSNFNGCKLMPGSCVGLPSFGVFFAPAVVGPSWEGEGLGPQRKSFVILWGFKETDWCSSRDCKGMIWRNMEDKRAQGSLVNLGSCGMSSPVLIQEWLRRTVTNRV